MNAAVPIAIVSIPVGASQSCVVVQPLAGGNCSGAAERQPEPVKLGLHFVLRLSTPRTGGIREDTNGTIQHTHVGPSNTFASLSHADFSPD